MRKRKPIVEFTPKILERFRKKYSGKKVDYWICSFEAWTIYTNGTGAYWNTYEKRKHQCYSYHQACRYFEHNLPEGEIEIRIMNSKGYTVPLGIHKITKHLGKLTPYASAIPSNQCLDELYKYCDDWRFLLSPVSLPSIGKRNRFLLWEKGYAIDNGVYSYWAKGKPFDDKAFFKLLDRYAQYADWIVIPDAVGDWEETLKMFMIWTPKLRIYNRPLMLVAQDGCQRQNFREIKSLLKRDWGINLGIFVGGKDDFKLSQSSKIAQICKQYNALCHIGRVNSAKRTRMCWDWEATSFDGSLMSRFPVKARIVSEELSKLRNQGKLIQQSLF